jgi:hypothetical protein
MWSKQRYKPPSSPNCALRSSRSRAAAGSGCVGGDQPSARRIELERQLAGVVDQLDGNLGSSDVTLSDLYNKSYSVTADIEVPESGASGVIVSLGAGVGGWSLYAHGGRLTHCSNFFGIERYFAESAQEIPAGRHQVRAEFDYDGGGLAQGGTVSLFIDGEKSGEGRVDRTVPMLFGTDTCAVGSDAASPVSPDYGPKANAFNGTIDWMQFDIGENAEDLDHLVTPEERYQVAMARQ